MFRCVSWSSDPPIAEVEFSNKYKEVGDDPLTRDGAFEYGNKLQKDVYLSFRRETSKSKITMFRFVSVPIRVSFTIGESVRTSYMINPGCHSNTTEQSFSPAARDSRLKRNEVLSAKYLGNINFRTDRYCGVPKWWTWNLVARLTNPNGSSVGMSFAISTWNRNPNSRFIRFKVVTPSSKISCMETRSLQHSVRWNNLSSFVQK